MVEFLRIQYELGKVTKAQLQKLIDKVITKEDYKFIVGE